MKAIIVLFSGDYLSASHKKDAIGTIANIINHSTNSKAVEISEFDNDDILNLLAKERFKTESVVKDPVENMIRNLCNTIIQKIGHPSKKQKISFKLEFVVKFLTDKTILQENSDAIKYIISNNNVIIEKIFKEYDLSEVPDYLKEINNTYKIVQYEKR